MAMIEEPFDVDLVSSNPPRYQTCTIVRTVRYSFVFRAPSLG